MSTLAVSSMVVICGVVWGGLATLVAYAVRRESRKLHEKSEEKTDPR